MPFAHVFWKVWGYSRRKWDTRLGQVLGLLGVDPIEASFAIRAQFSASGLQALIAIDDMQR